MQSSEDEGSVIFERLLPKMILRLLGTVSEENASHLPALHRSAESSSSAACLKRIDLTSSESTCTFVSHGLFSKLGTVYSSPHAEGLSITLVK